MRIRRATQEKKEIISLKDIPWGRDPFIKVPQKAVVGKGPRFTLTAIIWDESKPAAIINDEVVVVGQEIQEYKVLEISESTAVIQKGDDILILEMYQ